MFREICVKDGYASPNELPEAGGMTRVRDPGDGQRKSRIVEVPAHHLLRLFDSTKAINAEIVPKETINIIIQETLGLVKADRVSLFVFDKGFNVLILTASNMTKPIRIQPGQGIAGTVFQTGEVVNIPDCYQDSRFDQSFDKATGYHTRSLLCMPIKDFEGACCGVLQAINKEDEGVFDDVDELLMGHLAQHAGIALRNADVYRETILASDRANALLHTIQSLAQDLGVQSVVLTITMHASELVQADRCTVFLVDQVNEQLFSISTDSTKEIRIPKTVGIAGECATTGLTIEIADAYENPLFNQEFDKSSGYRTKSILAVPIKDDVAGAALGVIQMINKIEFDGEIGVFNADDVQVLETFARFIGPKVTKASLLTGEKRAEKTETEASAAFHGFSRDSEDSAGKYKPRKSLAPESVTAIMEGAEDGDDEDD
mmetsp:Transcript_19864/g.48714  ORF Transcript_19864/g.48714 Transcript_19864/m.48714 type:complete len:431 (-) Transcript_19864:172-1464(-)